MINLNEIRSLSSEWGLPIETIEKDYVLGWLLSGIARNTIIGTAWVFKGGTCLKKCYMETWRFSEDLDFTVLPKGIAEQKEIKKQINTILEQLDLKWKPPITISHWEDSTYLERIRFAAANRLCVDLRYQDSSRVIEPYSLRKTKDGNIVLYARKHNTKDDRSYRVDRIEGAAVTKTAFVPVYKIEI